MMLLQRQQQQQQQLLQRASRATPQRPALLGARTARRSKPTCIAHAAASDDDAAAVPTSVRVASLPVSQQSLAMAFSILDKDQDGRISRAEASQLVSYYLALLQHQPAPASRRPLTWDQHLASSIATARKLSSGGTGIWPALEGYVAAKVRGGLQAHPLRASDLVWGSLGMATAVLALGLLAAASKSLPVVGHFHQAGAPLLLGSFGTLAILLFGKPEAEPVRLWPLMAGQLGAAAIAVAVVKTCGASILSRAAAMAATVAWMMWADCVHPPGGALVLMAMDNAAIQAMSWSYLLWPSLAISVGLLLPLSAAVNWLRRSCQFDAPWAAPDSGPATLQQKAADFQAQQAAKHKAVLRQYMALELDRGNTGQQVLHVELQSRTGLLACLLGPLLQLLHFPAPQRQPQRSQPQQQWRGQMPHGWGPDMYSNSSGGGSGGGGGGGSIRADLTALFNLGRSVQDAGPAQAAAAAALDAAIRRRLLKEQERAALVQEQAALEQERSLEDREHKRRIWGGSAQLRGLERFEAKLNRMHAERMQQQRNEADGSSSSDQEQREEGEQQQQQEPAAEVPQQPAEVQKHTDVSSHAAPSSAQASTSNIVAVSPLRQRLQRHWTIAAEVAAARAGGATDSLGAPLGP